MDIGGLNPKFAADGSSSSAQELVPPPSIPPLEEQPVPKVAPGFVTLVSALMHNVIASLNVPVVLALELLVAEPIASTTFAVVATLVVLELEVLRPLLEARLHL